MSADHSTYTPTTGIEKWVDSRLPLPRLVHDSFVSYPVPRNLNYAYTFGAMLSVMLIVQILTGIVLAMHYAAETSVAFNSVEKIMRDGQSRLAAALPARQRRVVLSSSRSTAYRPRHLLRLLQARERSSGSSACHLSPDDGDPASWATSALGADVLLGATVITVLLLGLPLVGEWIQQFPARRLWRRPADAQPLFLAALPSALHDPPASSSCTSGRCMSPARQPTGVEVKSKSDTVPFTPYATLKDALGVSVFLIVYAWFVFYMPNFLGHPDNYIPADALKTPAHIVPEWYYLPFYAMLRAITFNVGPIDSKLGGVLVMFGSILILFFLPWLDTSKVRSAVYRPWYKLCFWIFVADCILLGWLGSRPAEGIYVVMSQLGTLYYFAFFLVIMPILGLIETPSAFPNSSPKRCWEKQNARRS